MADRVQFFEHVGDLAYAGFMKPVWMSFRDLTDPRQALELFLSTYAFEHQGRSPAYAPAAVASLRSTRPVNGQRLWVGFRELLGERDPNRTNNPLSHERSDCSCIACQFAPGGQLRNLVTLARDGMRDGRIPEVRRELMAIRGVGPKIASFFMRDVALWFDIRPTSDRELLQPVDIWVRRAVEMDDKSIPDGEVQRWICTRFNQPEKANHGMWYFGSQVARSSFQLDYAMRGRNRAERLLDNHVASFAAVVEAHATSKGAP